MKRRVRLMALCSGLVVLCSTALVAQERWVYRFPGLGEYCDVANCIASGPGGSLCAAGYSYDYFTVVSLTCSGEERWIYQYNIPGAHSDEANSVAMGPDGNVYVAGRSWGGGSSSDFTVVSLTDSGTERWVYRYNGSGNSWDEAKSIIMGSDGNLYVAGQSYGSGTYDDFFVASLTDSGTERWIYRYNGSGNGVDGANWIVMGSDGNLYAAGSSTGSGTNDDFTVVSLTDSGAERWIYQYSGSGNGRGNSIVMGLDGNLYAAGSSTGSGTNDDFTVVSLTNSGTGRWIYSYDAESTAGNAHSVTVGPDGNVYAAGYSYETMFRGDFTVVSLTPSGDERWVYRYNSLLVRDHSRSSIITGLDNNVYAAGTTGDFTVVSLTDSGVEQWLYQYDVAGDIYDFANSIVVGSDGNLYAAGSVFAGYPIPDCDNMVVVSLTADLGVQEQIRAAPKPPHLQVSVSIIPGARGARVSYSLPNATQVKLSVYDLCGRLVKNLVNDAEESGSRTVLWDGRDSEERRVASGTYFTRLEAAGFYISRKFVLF